MHKRLLLNGLFLLAVLVAKTQNESFVFSHLNESDGLSDNVVNCIIKDHRGFIWMGTYNGFSRFDGANFYSYKPRKGSNTMLNEVVHSMCEDSTGLLWGATNNGVFSYDPLHDRFTNYPLKSLGIQRNFNNVLCDRSGVVWATGAWSLFRFNRKAGRFFEVLKTVSPKDTGKHFFITKNGLAEDPVANRLWMTTTGGLWYYDVATEKAGNTFTINNNPLFAPRNTAALCRSANGHFWFFDNNQKAAVRFAPGEMKQLQQVTVKEQLPAAAGATLFEDKSNRLWFSSWTYEMLVIDLAHGNTIKKIRHQPEDRRSIAGNFFWSAYQDANNTIWLATVSGVSRCNPEKNLYKEYHIAGHLPFTGNSAIIVAEEDPANKTLWLVNARRQLVHYEPAGRTGRAFDLDKATRNKQGQLPGNCKMICFVNDKVVIATSTGAWQLTKQTGQLVPFSELPKGFAGFNCLELLTCGDSVIYFSNGKELLYWNREKNVAHLIPYTGSSFTGNLYGLKITPAQQVWAIVPGNMLAMVKDNKALEPVALTHEQNNEAGVFISVLPDSKNNLWVVNRGEGLYYYNTTTKDTRLWNETDGLPGNRVHNIMYDKSGKLWAMMYNKVSVYIPVANKFYNFRIPYSESNLAYINHVTRLSNGNILGTIYDEVFEFYPERLLNSPVLQKPLISQLSVEGNDFPITENNRLVLKANENTIRLKFGAPLSKEIFPYDLEYKLSGAEKNWTVAGEKAEAIYNKLPPGKYTFRVRISGKNSTWQSEEAVLFIVIKTPFYKSAWFFAALAIIFFVALYLFYRNRIGQKEKLMMLETKAQELEKEKAMVMYEHLKQHLNPHFLFNSLTSLSSLIRIDSNMAGNFLDKMSKVYRYILKNRDNEVVPLSEEKKFVQLYIDLQQTRFGNGLRVHMNIAEEYLHRKVAPVTLQNLVENAIKHNTADEGSPLVIEMFVETDYLVVRNNLQKKKFVETSNQQGLVNMESLYRFLSHIPMQVIEDATHFTVKIPLI